MTTQDTLKRFDRHSQMTAYQVSDFSKFTSDLFFVDDQDRDHFYMLSNSISGLFDGYYYKDDLAQGVADLRKMGYKSLANRLNYIILAVEKFTFNS